MAEQEEQTGNKKGGRSGGGARPFAPRGARAGVASGAVSEVAASAAQGCESAHADVRAVEPPAAAGAQAARGAQAAQPEGHPAAKLDAHEVASRAEELFTGDFWRLLLALSLAFSASSFMNVSVFPLFDGVFTYARDISVLANAAAFLALGLVATFRPATLRVGSLNAAMLVAQGAGCALVPASLAVGSAAGLVLGSSLLAVGRAWCVLAAGIACARLSRAQMAVIIAFAFAIQCVASTYAWILPIWVGMLLFLLLPWLAWALAWRDARPVLEMTQDSAPPSDFSITQPSSFLPLASQLFVCLFLFHVAFGCSLRFGEVGGAPLSSFGVVAPIAVAALFSLVVCLLNKKFPTDVLVQISVLTVVAGFMAMTIQLPGAGDASVVLLSTGNTLFDMVAWMALVAVASRNERASVAAIAWGRGVSGLGTILGAGVGVQANGLLAGHPETLGVFSAVLVLCFTGYALIGLKNFSFAQAINGVTPVDTAVATAPQPTFEERCDAVAAQYGLTPRELEVFRMLARGRDAAYIQEQLTVSRNTVKAHVKHIYAKLDIHSHQDLIDLVED